MSSAVICGTFDRQFYPEPFSSLEDVTELEMSDWETYRVMMPPRKSVPKRLLFRKTVRRFESTTHPNTASAVHDDLVDHEAFYIGDNSSMEPSTGE